MLFNLAIAAILFCVVLLVPNNGEETWIIGLIIVALLGLILVLTQITLFILYIANKTKYFDFVFIFTCVFSILLIIPYVIDVVALIEMHKTMIEISKDLAPELDKVILDSIQNYNPFWGMHTLQLVPLGFQIIILTLRLKRAKIDKSNIA